jgi:hypothetical protein
MEADLRRIKVALAVMSSAELDALIDATYKAEQIAPGLLAWLDTACVWQVQRRNGYHFELQPPEAAIPPRRTPSVLAWSTRCEIHLRKNHRRCAHFSMRSSIC